MKKVKYVIGAFLVLVVCVGGMQIVGGATQPVKAAPKALRYRSGHATWYDLCTGTSSSGACGYCDDDAMHAAWPHLDQTGCHRYCSNSFAYSVTCGDKITVSDLCPYKPSIEVEIRDCCTCNGTGGCNGTSSTLRRK